MNNRLTSAADPTGATSYKYYNNDGSLSKIETAYQHATGTGTTFTYDVDGDVYQQNVSRGGTYVNPTPGPNPTPTPVLNSAVTTTKYYDGADRLVEVVEPQDSYDVYTKPWITRYIYDLSQNQPNLRATYQGQTLIGYGNLIKTQEFLPAGQTLTAGPTKPGSFTPTQFEDLKAQSFDALDRVVAKLQMVNATPNDVLNKDSNTYDGAGNYGLLTSSCNALNQCTTPAYNNLAQIVQLTFSDSTPTKSFAFDADGRTASVSNTYGTQKLTYDIDGRETQSAESLGSVGSTPLTAPATLTYHYYADGTRSSIDVSTSGFNQPSLFSYAYRVDGPLAWLQVNDVGNSKVATTALSMHYDNLGRLTSRTESGTGANATAIGVTYNAYGMATQKSYPGGTLQGIEYDATGAPLGYQSLVTGTSTATTYTNTFSTRGEVYGVPMANGVVVSGNTYVTWDPLMAEKTGTSSMLGGCSCITTSTYFNFDGAGRMTGNGTDDNDGLNQISWGSTVTKSYDAEDHITSEAFSGDPKEKPITITSGSAAYVWGANGHPIAVGSGYSATTQIPAIAGYDTLHWDGDQLLFTSNPQGQIDDIKVGDIADITPSGGLTFYDRGFNNEVSFCHSAAGYGGDGSTRINQLGGGGPCGSLAGAPGSATWSAGPGNGNAINGGVGNGGILVMPRSDQLTDGYNAIQGVRAFDGFAGTWTTPDAYSGDVHDPMSQKSYMWNDNNPVSYSDPSGYFYNGSDAAYDSLASGVHIDDPNAPAEDSTLKIHGQVAVGNLYDAAAGNAFDLIRDSIEAITNGTNPSASDSKSFLERLQKALEPLQGSRYEVQLVADSRGRYALQARDSNVLKIYVSEHGGVRMNFNYKGFGGMQRIDIRLEWAGKELWQSGSRLGSPRYRVGTFGRSTTLQEELELESHP